jgi:transaldolase / glucose-6-phosphate isomerase
MNNLQKLEQLGQSIWYDNISRGVILKGELKKMVDEGCLGVTSNPTIFDKAISGSSDYDDQIRDLVAENPRIDAGEIIQALMVKDIQMACDVLRPVFDRTKGGDGFVSIEVTPAKARDTQATIEEVRELWSKVNRPNLMVKIPATNEGLPAIEQAIYEGKNINVTLIFSVERYREVADAYIKGLERRMREGKPVESVRSVASVFVSRIDTLVDDLLAKKDQNRFNSIMGKTAVANTKFIYQAFKEIFGLPRFATLKAKGAAVQRPLWGSTGTKNPAYSDLLYVDALIGPHTVNTVPPATYTAILDHGKPALTVESNIDAARKALAELGAAGIDMKWVLQKLEDDGVAAFEKSFDGLYANLTRKRGEFAAASRTTA